MQVYPDLASPRIMGILNVTPDSFSDGGRYNSLERALVHARAMIAAGADIIDIGGESTRPTAQRIPVQEEIDRVVPVVAALRKESDSTISVDTSSPEVMREAVAAGASIINDVRALSRPGALEVAAEFQVPVVLMHSLLDQQEPGVVPVYDDIVAAIGDYFLERVRLCELAGIKRENIILDPGFGGGMFGKTPALNYELVKRFDEFKKFGFPLLAGVSRKGFIGTVLDNTADERMVASVALAVLLAQVGAQILRVHDVRETADALAMLRAVADA